MTNKIRMEIPASANPDLRCAAEDVIAAMEIADTLTVRGTEATVSEYLAVAGFILAQKNANAAARGNGMFEEFLNYINNNLSEINATLSAIEKRGS